MFNFLTCNGLVSDMYSGSEMYLTATMTAITLKQVHLTLKCCVGVFIFCCVRNYHSLRDNEFVFLS